MIAGEAIVGKSVTAGDAVFAMNIVAGSEPADISINGTLFLEDQEGAVAINVHDQNGNDVGSENVGGDWEVPIYNTASPIKTGQTVSYVTGDDGDRQDGRLADFTTLEFNNPFGNTNRFTDELGGQDYANNILIDWSSWSQGDDRVLGYAMQNISKVAFSAAISGAAATSIGSFNSGWRLPNVNECISLCNLGATTNVFNYSPVATLLNAAQDHWTSSTIIGNPNGAYCIRAGQLYLATVNKTSFTAYWYAVRTFTLTELGL